MTSPPLHLTRWGTAGPRIVMIHGSAQGSSTGGDRHFAGQQVLGDRGYQVIVPDRPGHGRSPYPGRPDDAEADGAWVTELLGSGAHLVGHSFGGCVALAAAVMRPAAVRSLTVIEPAMPTIAMGNPTVLKFGLSILAANLLSTSTASRTRKFNRILGIPPEIRGDSGPEEAEKVGEGLRTLKMPSKGQLSGWLETLKKAGTPFLVVSGGWNPAFEALSDTAARLGGGQRRVIRSPHHFPQNVSDEFNRILAQRVDEIEAKQLRAG